MSGTDFCMQQLTEYYGERSNSTSVRVSRDIDVSFGDTVRDCGSSQMWIDVRFKYYHSKEEPSNELRIRLVVVDLLDREFILVYGAYGQVFENKLIVQDCGKMIVNHLVDGLMQLDDHGFDDLLIPADHNVLCHQQMVGLFLIMLKAIRHPQVDRRYFQETVERILAYRYSEDDLPWLCL
jgi:hypothetical protein